MTVLSFSVTIDTRDKTRNEDSFFGTSRFEDLLYLLGSNLRSLDHCYVNPKNGGKWYLVSNSTLICSFSPKPDTLFSTSTGEEQRQGFIVASGRRRGSAKDSIQQIEAYQYNLIAHDHSYTDSLNSVTLRSTLYIREPGKQPAIDFICRLFRQLREENFKLTFGDEELSRAIASVLISDDVSCPRSLENEIVHYLKKDDIALLVNGPKSFLPAQRIKKTIGVLLSA